MGHDLSTAPETEEQEVPQSENVIAPVGLTDEELKQIAGGPRITND